MSIRSDLNDLVEMYSAGGLQVVTLLNGEDGTTTESDTNRPYNGKIHDLKGVRSIIQPDGDLVTVISREVLIRPKVWQRHTETIDDKLAVLDKLKQWARQSWVLFLIIPIAWAIYDVKAKGFPEVGFAWLGPIILSLIIALAKKQLLQILQVLVLPLIMRIVMRYIHRRLEGLLTSGIS
jgi:hypothetical protein